MADIKELQVRMAEAIANNDVAAMEAIAGEITKGKSDRHKAEVEAQRKEAEAMAGDREALATTIHTAIVQNGAKGVADIAGKLTTLKATGFTFKLDTEEVQYKSVALTVPAIGKAKASGNGGGGAGKTKDEFGMSLAEVYDKFKTDEDEAKLAEAQVKDEEASTKLGKTTNSNQWRVKNEVKKRVIASGELAPAK